MHLTDKKIIFHALFLVSMLLSACGGGGGGGGGTTTVRSAYVANSGDGTISQYTIGGGGALTPKGTPTVASMVGNPGSSPTSVTVDPAGKYAYVANSGNEVISQFTIGTGGGLVPMIPPTVPSGSAGSGPVSITVDPTGRYAYAANSSSNDVAQFTIDAMTGALSPMGTPTVTPCPSPPCAQGMWPVSVTVDAKSQYVYVANLTSDTVSQFAIGPGGALTPMSTATVGTGLNPISVAVAGDSTGSKYVYVANNGSANVSQYIIGATGALTPNGTPIAAGNILAPPTAITVAGDITGSKYVYVTTGSDISRYTINLDGTLALPLMNPTFPAGSGPQSVTVAGDSTGSKYVYVANRLSNDVWQYSIDATTGALTQMALPVATGSLPWSITTAVSAQ